MTEPVAPPPASPVAPVWRPAPPSDGTATLAVASVIAGPGVPLLYVAWLNRGGPGEVCRPLADGSECFEAWSPWAFVAAAAVLVLVAGMVLRAGLRSRRTAVAAGRWVAPRWLVAGWGLVGALGCLSVLSLLTIGIFVAPVTALLAAGLVTAQARLRP